MLITLFGFLILSYCGATAIKFVADLKHSRVDPLVAWGGGFFLCASAISVGIRFSPFSLSASSWLVLILGIATLVFRAVLIVSAKNRSPVFIFTSQPLAILGIIILIAVYLALILVANTAPEIFPWDAFTTWMYRAKLWTSQNQFLPLNDINSWLAQGDGYAIDAAHYPATVSIVAAFASILSGGWHPPSAAVPWFFAAAASSALMIGLCRERDPDARVAPVLAGAFLITTPLLHIHGMLAGYADLWVLGTSGMGLASLCIWGERKSDSLLLVSLTLLALGPLFKLEGWVWLGVGVSSLLLLNFPRKHRLVFLVITITVAVCFFWLRSVDLPILGTWGFETNRVHLGPFGSFGLNPVDPSKRILYEVFSRGNFLLLAPLYLFALGWGALKLKREIFAHFLIGLLSIAAVVFIFGVSSYSIYTEMGTALNRLLLQLAPVWVITIITVGSHFAARNPPFEPQKKSTFLSFSSTQGGITVGLLSVMLATILTPNLWPAADSTSQIRAASRLTKQILASELESVSGALTKTARGHQFTDHEAPIGVARLKIEPGKVQPRYITFNLNTSSPDAASFFWINTLSSRVHSIPIATDGESVMDMSEHSDFWQLPIAEIGILVRPAEFPNVTLYSVGQSESLGSAHRELINLWITPDQLTHRAINGITGHASSPINFNLVLVLSVILALTAPITFNRVIQRQYFDSRTAIIAICMIWLIGSGLYLKQAYVFMLDLRSSGSSVAGLGSESNQYSDFGFIVDVVNEVSANLKSMQTGKPLEQAPMRPPILAFGEGADGLFFAQKLPYSLLPMPAASINVAQLANLPTGAEVLVVGFNAESTSIYDVAKQNQLEIQRLRTPHSAAQSPYLWLVRKQ